MILFPAIDLVAGQVVRLRCGERSQMDVYASDPVTVARDFARAGAHWIHVVDLSATFGEDGRALAANRRAIEGICGVEGISVDVGGGVRSLEAVERLAERCEGVLVLADLGSGIMSAEMALEMLDPALAERTRLSAAPFVEGLLGAYGAAGIGKDLQAVAAETDGAAEAKRSQVAAF